MKEVEYTIKFQIFQYIDELTDFFNENRNCELITFSVGKNRDTFIAIYKDYKREKETNFK